MDRVIRQVPTLSHLSLSGKTGSIPYPLRAPKQAFWYSGQIAIWQGIRAIGLKEGDRVLVPAYSCGSEIDALVKAGLTLAFYRVTPDLSPDFEHLIELCVEPAKALFVIHYFGLPQPIDALLSFAAKHQLILIEDNAHGLFSDDEKGRPLGSLGDICIFSFTKTLAIPDGGALIFSERAGNSDEALTSDAPSLGPTLGRTSRILRGAASHNLPAAAHAARWVRRRIAAGMGRETNDDDFNVDASAEAVSDKNLLDMAHASWRMSAVSRHMLRRTDHSSIRNIRRRNFTLLLQNFEGGHRARALISRLPSGCSPMMFPVWADEPLALLRHLLKAGIESDVFWDFTHPAAPMASFPFEDDLKRRCIEIPVHQCLGDDDMAIITGALNNWNATSAPAKSVGV